jgi:TPR repeat protein
MPRPRRRRERRDPLYWETEDRPGSLLQLPACLGNDDLEGDACEPRMDDADEGEGMAVVRHLRVAAERGHLEAMYLLAQSCGDKAQRIHWLTLAAERGHVPAMHDLGLASITLHERRRWLLKAARHGWAEAMAELGDVECS